VARTKERQRALARAKLERQIARRAAAARRRRQIQAGTAAGLALVLVVLGVLWFSGVFKRDKAGNTPSTAQDCTWTPESGSNAKDVGFPPTTGIAKSGTQTMTITTDKGIVEAEIDTSLVPCTAASFTHLASKNFFDNTQCHRLTTSGIYVVQCGDPSGTGSGGPTYKFADENLPTPTPSASDGASPSAAPSVSPQYTAGTLAMANSGPNTNGSQFFMVYKDSALDAKYTVIGRITKGLDVVQKVADGGVAEGGTSPTDGKPKIPLTIQTLTMTPAGGAPSAEPSPATSSGSATPES
jgi:peptidyl-prolyl cis-trans isomerase B (cyclophilin B)